MMSIRQKMRMGWSALFPYRPYSQQMEFMNDAFQVLERKGVMVAEACNGFGKTVCALSAAIPLERRILYTTRTHEQARHVLNEIKTINTHAHTDHTTVALASREHLCLHEKCRELTASDAVETCRLLRREDKCRYLWDLEDTPSEFPSNILSIQTLVKLGRKERLCPYSVARRAAGEADVVVAPYQYIFNVKVREQSKLEVKGKTLIFDEAHNADKVGVEVLSSRLSEKSLKSAKEELDEIGERPLLLLRSLSEYLASSRIPVKRGGDFHEDLRKMVTPDPAGEVEEIKKLVERIRSYKMGRGRTPRCSMGAVAEFLSLLFSSQAECYVAIFRVSVEGYGYVEYRCLDPSLAVKPVLGLSEGGLIMSGTLSPLEFFAKVIGVEGAELRSYSSIAKPENISTIMDGSVTTSFHQRSDDMLTQYGERILEMLRFSKNGVLIFFPQRKLLERAVEVWRYRGVLEQALGEMRLGGRKVFIEGGDAGENVRTLEAYRREARGEGAVLLGVFRGRNAEGANFPDEEARTVFLVGVPYADYSDPLVKAQMDYFEEKWAGFGRRWYVMDAFRAANQALGRGIRHREDSCRFILMDERYRAHINLLAGWAVSNGVKFIDKISTNALKG